MFRSILFFAWLVVSLANTASAQVTVHGAGASFPGRVYKDWAAQYSSTHATQVQYESVGSGKGLQRIVARQIDFGASDVALSKAQLQDHRLVQFPSLVGAIVPVVNLPGLQPNELQLDGPTLAALMLGTIAHWDDPRLATLNPKLKLPKLPVVRVVRADKSGSTQAYTDYLSRVSEDFKRGLGPSELPAWPGHIELADGNDGVVKALEGQSGALGYVSYDRVLKHELTAVRLRTPSGEVVSASEASIQAAIRSSNGFKGGDETAALLNLPGAGWPITVATFLLVNRAPLTADQANPALQFLYWVFLHGDRLVSGTGFVPLPIALQAKIAGRFAEIQPQDGRTLNYVTP